MATIKISGRMKEIELNKPKTLKQEMIEAIENDMFYGFIFDNAHRFSRDQLVTIIQEYEYTRHMTENYGCMGFKDELIEYLEERFED